MFPTGIHLLYRDTSDAGGMKFYQNPQKQEPVTSHRKSGMRTLVKSLTSGNTENLYGILQVKCVSVPQPHRIGEQGAPVTSLISGPQQQSL
jgi:hypothetical protein